MKLASLVKRVENPEYTTEPVVSLPYGLAPKQTRSYDHDPSLGYRQPATTNIGNGANVNQNDEMSDEDAEEALEEDAWMKQNLRLKEQRKHERNVEVANLERYQKLRVLALRPAISPLRPQSVSLSSPLNSPNNSAILSSEYGDDRLETPSTSQILDPAAFSKKIGEPPTAPHARAGLLTPPGITSLASENSRSDLTRDN